MSTTRRYLNQMVEFKKLCTCNCNDTLGVSCEAALPYVPVRTVPKRSVAVGRGVRLGAAQEMPGDSGRMLKTSSIFSRLRVRLSACLSLLS